MSEIEYRQRLRDQQDRYREQVMGHFAEAIAQEEVVPFTVIEPPAPDIEPTPLAEEPATPEVDESEEEPVEEEEETEDDETGEGDDIGAQ